MGATGCFGALISEQRMSLRVESRLSCAALRRYRLQREVVVDDQRRVVAEALVQVDLLALGLGRQARRGQAWPGGRCWRE